MVLDAEYGVSHTKHAYVVRTFASRDGSMDGLDQRRNDTVVTVLRFGPRLPTRFAGDIWMAALPQIGQLVSVRGRSYAVSDIVASTLVQMDAPLGEGASTHLINLSSVEDDGEGESLQVIWECEPGARALEAASLPEPTGFDDPKQLEAFLDAVNWGAVSQADDRTLQAPFRSGIDVDEYQLDPVVRALTMPRVNLLVADDVGLGKTIEAGLVVQEMLLRKRVQNILIVCPSALQVQWQEEMRDKFGLEFRIVDSAALAQLRRKRGVNVNPWSHFPRLITSIDFLKRERSLRLFRETLPAPNEPAYPRRYDLLIVDEAHNVAPSGRGKYATDSLRTSAIRTLAPHFEHKLFLTATPHNGYRESFAALLELLDNQRFARAVAPDRSQLEAVMVRRLKSELKLRWDGTRRFADRKVQPLEVAYTPLERHAHKALAEYSRLRLADTTTDGQRMAAEFVLKLLKKRLFSSPAAFAITLDKHIAAVSAAHHTGPSTRTLQAAFDELDEDFANDEDYDEKANELVTRATRTGPAVTDQERILLGSLKDYAERATVGEDSKSDVLLNWLGQHIRPGGAWNDNRVIIFTEYRATQRWLYDLLARHGYAQDDRLLMMYGGMPADERERIKAAFQARPEDAKVRILLATDAASEGLNLQNFCSRLIHYEIPWNPNRMEQRNGRVDRHGQREAQVDVYHFVGSGFQQSGTAAKPGELEADLEFLMRAALKVETIREDLGKVGPVIAAQVEEAMLGKRSHLDTAQAEHQNEAIRKMLRFERQLKVQLEKLAEQLGDTRSELHLTPERILNVVQTGLALANQPPLQPVPLLGNHGRTVGEAYVVPALTGSWSACTNGLEHPHTKVVRPLVFDPALAAGRDDVVLAHLNHRLVQMCLRLLRADLWSQGTSRHLSRICACVVDDPGLLHPTVVAHGRIVVLGGDQHRLHEEVILAGGQLKEGRYSRLNVGETRKAWATATESAATDEVEARLQALWPSHRDNVLKALEARTQERTRNLQKTLEERAESEVQKMTAILTELGRSIRQELAHEVDPQLTFDWAPMERDQRRRDLDALRRRLAEIPEEIQREAEHLRSRYRAPNARLFPIAITYLIPRRAVVQLSREAP